MRGIKCPCCACRSLKRAWLILAPPFLPPSAGGSPHARVNLTCFFPSRFTVGLCIIATLCLFQICRWKFARRFAGVWSRGRRVRDGAIFWYPDVLTTRSLLPDDVRVVHHNLSSPSRFTISLFLHTSYFRITDVYFSHSISITLHDCRDIPYNTNTLPPIHTVSNTHVSNLL